MKDIIDWEICKSDFIKKVEIDKPQIMSIIETAESRLNFLRRSKVTSETVSFVIEGYYEVIKELLTALLLKNGFRSKNHQCLISFFYHNYKEYELEANLILRLSFLRNRLNYYGEKITLDYYNKDKFENIINVIKNLL